MMTVVDLDQTGPPPAPLLAAVEGQGETVLLCRAGRAAAELRAVQAAPPEVDPLQTHPELAGRILYDPTEPATEDDWPGEHL